MAKLVAVGHLGCEHCSRVFKIADELRERYPEVKVEKVEITKNHDIALTHNIFYSPAIVVDDRHVFHGIPNEEKIVEKLKIFRW